MSLSMRKIYLCLIGLIAGATVWPIIEVILKNQETFSSYFILSIVSGLVFGLFIGAFFGTINGIVLKNNYRILTGAGGGILTGAAAGIFGFLTSQVILFVAGETILNNMRSFNSVGLPVSRAIGWAVMGIFIGAGEGLRSKSLSRMKSGMLGGLIGGALGGFALEYLVYFWPDTVIARFAGFLIFGTMLGFFYGLVESRMSFGKLQLLNGKYKGKEFIINQGSLKIGKKRLNDIVLNEYNQIEEHHADLKVIKNELFIKAASLNNRVVVNDKQINNHKLIRDDVIQLGNAKLFYTY